MRSVDLRIRADQRRVAGQIEAVRLSSGGATMGATILFIALALFLAWALYAFSGAFLATLRQGASNRSLESAQRKLNEGDLSGSLPLFLKAESNWTMDAEHRSHKATLADLDQYGKIAAGIANAVGREASSCLADVRATLREMRELVPNRANFGVDGSGGESKSAVRWNASVERFKMLRAKLRATCDPRILR